MITRLGKRILNLRRRLSRSEWAVRLLGLPYSPKVAPDSGLILIQIDGFSRSQFEKALNSGKMPFLKKLLKKEEYRLHTLYSGLPSSTPSVQGELFYGVKHAVPAFRFMERKSGKVMSMLDHFSASTIEKRLQKKSNSKGVLNHGSAYCDIYSGGASETHFCPASLGWGNLYKKSRPLALQFVFLLHFWILVRTSVLIGIELILAITDLFRGLISGQNFIKELLFVPSRVGICILMRELITLGAKIDSARGIPVIHLNYVGYDEQAHRRGPSSAFAHWSLKGIDSAIKGLWHSAKRSPKKHYDVWIYSDHGQEETCSYIEETGESVQEAINKLIDLNLTNAGGMAPSENDPSVQLARMKWLGLSNPFKRSTKNTPNSKFQFSVPVTAQGPLGHVYLKNALGHEEMEGLGKAMVHQAKIPLVMIAESKGRVKAWTSVGEFNLPENADKILGANHPFLQEATDDLIDLVHHPNSGTFVISGWRLNAKPMSFPIENGAHAGPGAEETKAFALLPKDIPLPTRNHDYLRPIDLHECIKLTLHPRDSVGIYGSRKKKAKDNCLRVMTYNVHSCIGMDGKLSPKRIARVIANYNPDLIALQELDVGRLRTGEMDQAHLIAQELKMKFHFHPALEVNEEKYGDAILSRFPMRLVKAGPFPSVPYPSELEPRGALWVEITVGDKQVQLINTHIGLRIIERKVQIEHLLGPGWLGHSDCQTSVILCGDLNTLPISPLYRKVVSKLDDAQKKCNNGRPNNTWFGHYPISRIDYIFVSTDLKVTKTNVPRTNMTRKASDHLPLIAEIRL